MKNILIYTAAILLPAAVSAGELSPLLVHPPRGHQLTLGAPTVRVSVRLSRGLDSRSLWQLATIGAEPVLLPDGSRAQVGRVLSMRVPRNRLQDLADLPGVERIEPAVPLWILRPLDVTGAEIEAHPVWSPPPPQAAVMGEGVLVADHEGSWDIFHPDFFYPDGGLHDFLDIDGDNQAGPGDRIDLDGDGTFESTLSLLEGYRSSIYTGESDYAQPGYQPDLDWLYVDTNTNSSRDYGPGAGYGDDDPAFGEPVFVGDDVNQDGIISTGERLVRLQTSKVQAVYLAAGGLGPHVYERGTDLSDYPVTAFDPAHGTGAIGVVAGGWPGLRRYTGIAPGAELLLVQSDDAVAGVSFANNRGAQVRLYEFSVLGDINDGSSNIEQAITESATQGFVQVAAAGNLAGSDHCMEIAPMGTGIQTARITTDGLGMYTYDYAMATISWVGARNAVSLAILGAGSDRLDIGDSYTDGEISGLFVQAWSDTNVRGTTSVLMYFTEPGGGTLPEVEITLELDASVPLDRVRGMLYDSASGWGKGVSWLDHVSDAGTALNPSTADEVLGIGAYGGRNDLTAWGWGAIGERRLYSGMGPRIDGQQVVDLSAPDDPYSTSSFLGGRHATYNSFGGTSGALPHAAGSAALVVSAFPTFTHDQVAAALTGSAQVDAQTGAVPNEAYGYGKVRPGRAILGSQLPSGSPPTLTLALNNPAVVGREAEIEATVTDPDGHGVQVLIAWDVGYDRIYETGPSLSRTHSVTPTETGRLPVVAQAIDPTGRTARALLVLDAVEDCATAGCPPGECCGPEGLCLVCDADGDGDPDATDCAPNNPDIHHGALEEPGGSAVCSDAQDNDCDGLTDTQDPGCRCTTDAECNDQNVCTADVCNPQTGCQNTQLPDGTLCGNQDVCTGTETCQSGTCVQDPAPNCDDNNPCTTDSCDPINGCQYTNLADGHECGLCKMCQNGTCVDAPDCGSEDEPNGCGCGGMQSGPHAAAALFPLYFLWAYRRRLRK